MSPRALTEQEKDFQRQKLMTKARELVLAHGLRRVSVDDIVRAAGIAKGTFYHFFSNKEDLMMRLVWEIYREFVAEAQAVIENSSPSQVRQNVGAFIKSLLSEPDKVFFFSNHEELESLIATVEMQELRDFNNMEMQAFAQLITLAGLDAEKVKPGVVHNFIHTMYFAISNDAVVPEYREETIDAMLAGLLCYIFGPEESYAE